MNIEFTNNKGCFMRALLKIVKICKVCLWNLNKKIKH